MGMTREEAKAFLTDISYDLGTVGMEYLSVKDGEKMREAIETLEQEPRKGHWLTHKEYCDKNNLLPSGLGSYFWCSECGFFVSGSAFYLGRYNYCPACGADMMCDSSKDDYKNRVIGVDLNHAGE